MSLELYQRLKLRSRAGHDAGYGTGEKAIEPEQRTDAPDAQEERAQAHRPSEAGSGPELPGWTAIGESVYRRVVRVEAPLGRDAFAGSRFFLPPDVDPRSVVYYDLETTGLSGGAGTVAFLCGIGRVVDGGGTDAGPVDGGAIDAGPVDGGAVDAGTVDGSNADRGVSDGSVEVEQLFLADHAGEPAFLSRIRELFENASLVVSYNGKAFDGHVLQNRFILHRESPPAFPQLDLLYPTRRLFGSRLSRCSLTEVGHELLRLTREGDIPGIEVPDVYFRYLQTRDTRPLERVFNHHVHDIVSLPLLLRRLEDEIDAALAGSAPALADRYQLARLLLERGRARSHARAGEALLQTAVQAAPSAGHAFRAGRYLARHLRRTGNPVAAGEIWELLFRKWNLVCAGIELSKYLEHTAGRLEDAYAALREALTWPHSEAFRSEIRYRMKRIERKLHRK